MPRDHDRLRDALLELLNLAAAFRGWNSRQLATALDRCNGNVVPESGMPKLDLVVRLAGALDWPVETVINHLLRTDFVDVADSGPHRSGPTHSDRVDAARDALRRGDAAGSLRITDTVRLLAVGSRERIDAALLDADAWEARGRWDRSIATLQRSLVAALNEGDGEALEGGVSSLERSSDRPRLLMRLARAYHRAGLAVEGRAVASEAIDACRNGDCATLEIRAEALLVRGLCGRDQLETLRHPPRRAAEAALADLEEAMALLAWPALQSRRPAAPALHHMASGAELELRAALGRVSGSIALAAVLESLEAVVDVALVADRARLEACGWWCVFGFGIAGRQPAGDTRHQVLAVLSNKAEEIAARVDCWALRERVLRLEFERRELIASEFGEANEWLLDGDDLAMIVGCVGASPRFREIGLGILRRATLVDDRPADPRTGR